MIVLTCLAINTRNIIMSPSKKTPAERKGKAKEKAKSGKIRIIVSKETGKKIHKAAMLTEMPPEHIVTHAISTGLSILANR
jgi:hypothetical protein